MEAVEVVCVEIQENENGEIVYVEKRENNSSEAPEEYCVMECEIASSESSTKTNCEETGSPVEILVFPNFIEKFTNCVTNEEELNMKKLKPDNQCDLNLESNEPISHDTENIIEDETDDDFDIVLKLDVDSDSDTDSDELVDGSGGGGSVDDGDDGDVEDDNDDDDDDNEEEKYDEEPVKDDIPEILEDSIEIQKSKLWTLLDKRDRCNTPSSRGCVTTTSGSLDVRRTYSGVLPKKSCVRESDDGFSQLPFRCKVCDQSFRQDSSLKIHLKVHAGKYSDSCIIN